MALPLQMASTSVLRSIARLTACRISLSYVQSLLVLDGLNLVRRQVCHQVNLAVQHGCHAAAVSPICCTVTCLAAGAPPKYCACASKEMWSPLTNSVIRYGPVPIGARLNASAPTCWWYFDGMIQAPNPASRLSRIGSTCLVTKRTVSSFNASTLSKLKYAAEATSSFGSRVIAGPERIDVRPSRDPHRRTMPQRQVLHSGS